MENEDYKKLYFHAFNRLGQLIEQAQTIQQELEELYLDIEEPPEP